MMDRQEFIRLIDEHKNKLIDPVEMLKWTWFRIIVLNLTDEAWDAAVVRFNETMGR